MAYDWLAISLSVYCCLRVISWTYYYGIIRPLTDRKDEYKAMSFQSNRFFLDDPLTLFSSVAFIVCLLQLIKLKYDFSAPFKKFLETVERGKERAMDDDSFNEINLENSFYKQIERITKSVDQLVFKVNGIDEEFHRVDKLMKKTPDIFKRIHDLEERIDQLETQFQINKRLQNYDEIDLLSESYLKKDRNCGCGDWEQHCYTNHNKSNERIEYKRSIRSLNRSENQKEFTRCPSSNLNNITPCPITLSKASSKLSYLNKRSSK
ncbi:hypothetical protein O3M35_001384 [Rhynocoris fuscipes]|uniref:Uncharacterized protein n=1 Tax=Rhynocoris fuscipes TaxID=488301 RepID=A0AAW1CNR6_9HEMI